MTSRASAGVVVRGQSLFTFTPLSRLEQAGELVHSIQQLSLARSLPEIHEIVRTADTNIQLINGNITDQVLMHLLVRRYVETAPLAVPPVSDAFRETPGLPRDLA